MNANVATEITRPQTRRSARARFVLSLGPLAVTAGVAWALFQPWRVTLLHPHGQGFWWLFVEPPLWVMAVGVLFALCVAPGLVEDLEAAEEEADAAAR
jgi:hypothetical protein